MRLTKRLLAALEEALIFRTAGELGSEAQSEQDYEDALAWVFEQQRKRERKSNG